jgi:hypothetical protein
MTRKSKQTRRDNFRAARLRRKLHLRRAMLDVMACDHVTYNLCDLPDPRSEPAADRSAGNPSQNATEKARPQTGALSHKRPNAKGTQNDD